MKGREKQQRKREEWVSKDTAIKLFMMAVLHREQPMMTSCFLFVSI